MKKRFMTLAAVILIAACSHNPPKPYGKPFPINPQLTQKASS